MENAFPVCRRADKGNIVISLCDNNTEYMYSNVGRFRQYFSAVKSNRRIP